MDSVPPVDSSLYQGTTLILITLVWYLPLENHTGYTLHMIHPATTYPYNFWKYPYKLFNLSKHFSQFIRTFFKNIHILCLTGFSLIRQCPDYRKLWSDYRISWSESAQSCLNSSLSCPNSFWAFHDVQIIGKYDQIIRFLDQKVP